MKLPRIRWRKPPEAKILDFIERHVKLCVSGSDELLRAVEAKSNGNKKDAVAHVDKLCRFEEEADAVRREVAKELARGILPPLSKEDLMRLIERLDLVCDWSKDAGRILEITPVEEFSGELRDLFLKFTKMVNRCVHILGELTMLLYMDYGKALDKCFEVEMIEEDVDSIYVESLKALHESDLSHQTMMLANELARALEMTADSCEDTADMIRVTIVSTFH